MDQQDPPLTPEVKKRWNKFIDFVAMQNMANNPILDQRNKQVGMSLLQKYNYANPNDVLPTDIVPKVQQELQDYRSDLVNQWKAGKIKSDGVKSEDDIMAGLSPVDGWPGSKTLSHKFPIAKATIVENGKPTVKDYGTDTQSFDKQNGLASNK